MPDVSLVDAAGVRHERAGADARIVSLVPSLTELLFDLGLGANVVGRTHFCVHPEDRVGAVPSVGGTKRINMARLRRLAPSHVVVNVDETPRELAAAIAGLGVAVVVTHPIAVDDNVGLYRLLGGLFGREAEAAALARRFVAARGRLAALARGLPERRVLYLIWRRPWMTVSPDTYISRLLALANWRTVGGGGGARYPEVALDAGLVGACDLVLFPSEPFRFTDAHIEKVRRAFPGARARLLAVDGALLSWYGSRAVTGLDYLAALAAGAA